MPTMVTHIYTSLRPSYLCGCTYVWIHWQVIMGLPKTYKHTYTFTYGFTGR